MLSRRRRVSMPNALCRHPCSPCFAVRAPVKNEVKVISRDIYRSLSGDQIQPQDKEKGISRSEIPVLGEFGVVLQP